MIQVLGSLGLAVVLFLVFTFLHGKKIVDRQNATWVDEAYAVQYPIVQGMSEAEQLVELERADKMLAEADDAMEDLWPSLVDNRPYETAVARQQRAIGRYNAVWDVLDEAGRLPDDYR